MTSVMFLLRNYSLKHKHPGGGFTFLPSIMDLDHMSLRLLVIGVTLLTASLAVGAAYVVDVAIFTPYLGVMAGGTTPSGVPLARNGARTEASKPVRPSWAAVFGCRSRMSSDDVVGAVPVQAVMPARL